VDDNYHPLFRRKRQVYGQGAMLRLEKALIGGAIERGNQLERPAETQMGVILTAAVCDQYLWRNELPEKEGAAPNEPDSDNGIGFGSLTGLYRPHAKHAAAANF
jgi:hypothetical protein